MRTGTFLLAAMTSALLLTQTSCNTNGGKDNNPKTDTTAVDKKAEAEVVKSLTTEDFTRLVADYQKNKEKFIGSRACIVDFYADWCGPCKQMAPIMERLAKANAGKVNFYKVNIDDLPEVADAYGIESIPTFMVCTTDGKIESYTGSQTEAFFTDVITRIGTNKGK
jgi:thioredoxin 1